MPNNLSSSSQGLSRARLVVCQGTAQLATAIAAMETHALNHGTQKTRNHLLIHSLCAPAGQDAEFTRCIGELASRATSWEGIHYLDPVVSSQLSALWQSNRPDVACKELRATLGLASVDELHIGQNINFEHQLLAEAYPMAEPIACGDGIGLNFTQDYFRQRSSATNPVAPPTWRDRWRDVCVRLRLRKPPTPRPKPFAKVKTRHRYLLLANLFDEITSDFHLIPAAALAKVFEQFAQHPLLAQSADLDRTAAAMRAAKKVVVLLSSNFSETQRMTLAGEIESCAHLVDEVAPSEATAIVIKPHPRDSHAKIRALRDSLSHSYQSVDVLDEPITFYAPFESILTRYEQIVPGFLQKTTAICVSSSCLGLEYLYGCQTHLGFGDARIERHFAPEWKALRRIHERDLIRAVHHVRSLRRADAA